MTRVGDGVDAEDLMPMGSTFQSFKASIIVNPIILNCYSLPSLTSHYQCRSRPRIESFRAINQQRHTFLYSPSLVLACRLNGNIPHLRST